MYLVVLSFFAGVLTILAPCILPILPILLTRSMGSSFRKVATIIGSLLFSIFVLTLLLKTGSSFLPISESMWRKISAVILFMVGVTSLFPSLWTKISSKFNISKNLKGDKDDSVKSDVLIGLSLGPIFSSCSPTFAIVVATVLPSSLLFGLVNILSYLLGLGLMLFLISFYGGSLSSKLIKISDPKSKFRLFSSLIIIVLAVLIFFGYDKTIESKILENGNLDFIRLEVDLIPDEYK